MVLVHVTKDMEPEEAVKILIVSKKRYGSMKTQILPSG